MPKLRNILVGCALFFAGACTAVTLNPVEVQAYAPDYNHAQLVWTINVLMEECPLDAPNIVQVMDLGDFWGTTHFDPTLWAYVIRLDASQNMREVISTLRHEWAHAMIWDSSQREGDDNHGPLWGVAHARTYRAVVRAALPDHLDLNGAPYDESEPCVRRAHP